MIKNPAASFTRPADTTPYASGDLVANNVTPGSVSPLQIRAGDNSSGGAIIFNTRLVKSGVGVTNSAFRVHYFLTQPTVANGDNGAFSPNNVANYLGFHDIPSMTATSDGAMGRSLDGTRLAVAKGGATSVAEVYALVEARGAYTPGSGEVFTVIAEALVGL